LSERAIGLFRKASDTWLGSVEASQAGRWAVHLQEELAKRNLTVEALSQRLDVSADKLHDWVEERAMVPVDKQRDIAFVLNLPIRDIFTDIEPRAQET
jgi:Cro/C1-type helix-turn-helix DNA-binding protein